jgi:hypothetical protein
MSLPNDHLARIDRVKLTDYLLNPEHPENGWKSGFFASLGYAPRNWRTLVVGLRRLARTAPTVMRIDTPYGRKYIQEGDIRSPDGTEHGIRLVWLVEEGADVPRLVTAYPSEGRAS